MDENNEKDINTGGEEQNAENAANENPVSDPVPAPENGDQIEVEEQKAPEVETPAPQRDVSNAKKKPAPKNKKKKFGPVSIVLLVLCVGVFCFAMFNIIKSIMDEEATRKELEGQVREDETYNMEPGPSEDIDKREGDNGTSTEVVSLADLNLDNVGFLKVNNLENFKQLNADTVGWVYLPGPENIDGIPIDISIVQTTDNDYYLNHSFSKKDNINGWVFADYENNMNKLTENRNAVFYGHARSYNMFGGLKDLNVHPDWYNNANNHFVKITTEKEETVWQIFSWYETTIDFYYIQNRFSSDDEYIQFLNTIQAKNSIRNADGSSVFQTFTFDKDTKIITLSTCKGSNPNNRVAVHAKLVKSRDRG